MLMLPSIDRSYTTTVDSTSGETYGTSMPYVQHFAVHRDCAEQSSGAVVSVGEARDSPHGNRNTSLLIGEGLIDWLVDWLGG